MVDDLQACEFLEWDSSFFGLNIGRVNINRLSNHLVQDIYAWSQRYSIDCLYFLADTNDYGTHVIASENGFDLVDIRIELTYSISMNPDIASKVTGADIRLYQQEDLVSLRDIARSNFQTSRFYTDPRFPDELCDNLYETWIEKASKGWADAVFVIMKMDTVAGFITCRKLQEHNEGQISLIAVAPSAQGQGYGTDLVNCALNWFFTQGITVVEVATQGRNIKALHLFERCGFTTSSIYLWYHKWFTHKNL